MKGLARAYTQGFGGDQKEVGERFEILENFEADVFSFPKTWNRALERLKLLSRAKYGKALNIKALTVPIGAENLKGACVGFKNGKDVVCFQVEELLDEENQTIRALVVYRFIFSADEVDQLKIMDLLENLYAKVNPKPLAA